MASSIRLVTAHAARFIVRAIALTLGVCAPCVLSSQPRSGMPDATADVRSAPVTFVLQSGDAVVNGRDVSQWNVSYGNTFVLAFDSNIADDSVQYAWVANQLAGLDRSRYRHVVVFFHHPPLSSGPHGGPEVERPTAAVRTRYLPLFRRHGVRLVLTGHEHLFEHWVERYRDSTGAWQRMDQIVSGGGGAPIYTYRDEPDLSTYRRMSGAPTAKVTHLVRPGKRVKDNPHHFLVVHVDDETMSVEYLGVDWGREFRPYKRPQRQITETAARH